MSNSCLTRSGLILALLAGTFGLAVSAASAQGNGPTGSAPGYMPSRPESLEVTSPRFRTQPNRLNSSVQPVSLSEVVPYGDLNIVTWSGARELHNRVRRAAADVCDRLAVAYPVYQSTTAQPCFKRALDDAMVKVDYAIYDAQQTVRFGY